jgi:RNA polymerase sigma-70 factor (ECF subfamily)
MQRRGNEERAELELALREAHAAGDIARVATTAIREYGPEILGLLLAVLGSQEDAAEVYSQFCEDLWVGLPGFRWESSLRTWGYVLARHALHAFKRDAYRLRRAGLSEHPEIAEIAERVRTATLTFLRTETKDRVMRLRESLTPDEQMLLILRVDRQMSWNDVALVMGEGVGDGNAALPVASLRKRFERLKERLRALVAQEDAPARRSSCRP